MWQVCMAVERTLQHHLKKLRYSVTYSRKGLAIHAKEFCDKYNLQPLPTYHIICCLLESKRVAPRHHKELPGGHTIPPISQDLDALYGICY